MRQLIALVFLGLAGWRGWVDWQLTMGEGNAFRMSSVDTVWKALSPGTHGNYLPKMRESEIFGVLSPLFDLVLPLPMVLVLLVLALLFWLIRKKKTKDSRRF